MSFIYTELSEANLPTGNHSSTKASQGSSLRKLRGAPS